MKKNTRLVSKLRLLQGKSIINRNCKYFGKVNLHPDPVKARIVMANIMAPFIKDVR